MAEGIERYRAQVDFRHTFEDASQKARSPTFFARNLPFYLELYSNAGLIYCDLVCKGLEKGCSVKVKYQISLIRPAKTVESAEFACRFDDCSKRNHIFSKIFPKVGGASDAMTMEVSLWADEPQGNDFKHLKEKLRQDLQIVANQVQNDAFASLLESGDFSDVTFVVNEDSSRVKAHKTILAARSDVFAVMFATDMAEAKDNEIKIDDMGATALKLMLRHIYTGQVGFPKGVKVDLKICQELANAGEKYGLENLKEYAAMAMTEFVSVENAWELFIFTKRLKAEAATKALASYFRENVDKILENA